MSYGFTIRNKSIFRGPAEFIKGALSKSPAYGIGYGVGAGGLVTQITNRATGVAMVPASCMSGKIQTDTTSLAAGDEATFVVTNGAVEVGDTIVLSIRSGSVGGAPVAWVSAVAAGSFSITVSNLHNSVAETGAIIINFAVIKAVSS